MSKETRCRYIGYSFRLTARVSTYHSLCYTCRGALAGTRKSSMGSSHEGSIRWPIAPWANALTTELHLAPEKERKKCFWWSKDRWIATMNYFSVWTGPQGEDCGFCPDGVPGLIGEPGGPGRPGNYCMVFSLIYLSVYR